MSDLPHILVVDDEPLNVEIITELLEEEGGYQISSAEDGEIALKMMEASPDEFDVILLDRMMPNMNGMDVLQKMKQHEVLQYCPVIFQTAKTSVEDISEGLDAGAHYYLTKPFDEDVLLSVVKTAVRDRLQYKSMKESLNTNKVLMGLLKTASFDFKTIDEARSLAALLCNACPEPQKVVIGLTELMVNAVEHGNLGVTYDEKSSLNAQGIWNEEVERRLVMPENADKWASVHFQIDGELISITIKDEGKGFDWEIYMDFDPRRVMDNHGRGIAIANKLSFTNVEYRGVGNQVCVQLKV